MIKTGKIYGEAKRASFLYSSHIEYLIIYIHV